MTRFFAVLLFFLSFNCFAQQSILNDTSYVNELREQINDLYNFNFVHSNSVNDNMLKQYPDHPFPDLYYSLTLYWKYFPITTESTHEPEFLSKLNSSILKAEKRFEEKETDETVFFNLMGRMLLMQYFADNQASSNLISQLKPSYKMLVKGFDLQDSFSDFKFSSGVYNYYREFYPKTHPIYKPVAYFFPKGDAKKGIKLLENNSKHGTFLHKESLSFLVYISMYFEQDYKMTLKYSKKLTKDNPNNLLFLSYHIQTLLLQKKYSKAKELIPQLKDKHSTDFFIALSNLYLGIIAEKKDKNFLDAKNYYLKSLQLLSKYGNFANTYNSISYFGLSRIYSTSDIKKSNGYRKKANKLVIFPHINFD